MRITTSDFFVGATLPQRGLRLLRWNRCIGIVVWWSTQCVRDLDILKFHLFVLHNTDTISFPLFNSHFLRYNITSSIRDDPARGPGWSGTHTWEKNAGETLLYLVQNGLQGIPTCFGKDTGWHATWLHAKWTLSGSTFYFVRVAKVKTLVLAPTSHVTNGPFLWHPLFSTVWHLFDTILVHNRLSRFSFHGKNTWIRIRQALINNWTNSILQQLKRKIELYYHHRDYNIGILVDSEIV